MLRVGASIAQGHVTSSLLIAKLQGHPRKNQLTRALQEYGRLMKTLFILRYLQDPVYRKRVGRQLDKGESVQALRDTILYAHHGAVRHRQLADQTAQAACLSLVVNCVAAWNAAYLAKAVDELRAGGFAVSDDDIAHLGPTMCQHINVHGRYHFNLGQPPKPLRPLTRLLQKTAG
jgi:TnpA family transposase